MAQGIRVVHLFHHTNSGGFIYLPLQSGECNTSHTPITLKATPAATYWRADKATYLTIRNQVIPTESAKWILIAMERRGQIGEWTEFIGEWVVSTLADTQRKSQWPSKNSRLIYKHLRRPVPYFLSNTYQLTTFSNQCNGIRLSLHIHLITSLQFQKLDSHGSIKFLTSKM